MAEPEPWVPRPWVPTEDAEVAAGWRLWLELSDGAWPGADWSGTPADAVRRIGDVLSACSDIEAEYLAASADPSKKLLRMLRSVYFVGFAPMELWRHDDGPLDPRRAELLHRDLEVFAGHVEAVLARLAEGGGWTALNADRGRH